MDDFFRDAGSKTRFIVDRVVLFYRNRLQTCCFALLWGISPLYFLFFSFLNLYFTILTSLGMQSRATTKIPTSRKLKNGHIRAAVFIYFFLAC